MAVLMGIYSSRMCLYIEDRIWYWLMGTPCTDYDNIVGAQEYPISMYMALLVLIACQWLIVMCNAFFSFSRKIIWLEVASTNNSSSVIAGYYLNAVGKYGKYFVISLVSAFILLCLTYSKGCPRILRADRGSENSRIAYLQPFLRRNGSGADNSFQYGRSASNQVCLLGYIYM